MQKILYDAFIFSRLNYGVELYANNNTQGQLNTLMIMQNKILKILQLKKRNAKTNELYREFEVLKLQDLHINKTNDLILNWTPENVTQHSRIE